MNSLVRRSLDSLVSFSPLVRAPELPAVRCCRPILCRGPQPLDPTKPWIFGLGNDILTIIIDLVSGTSPSTIANLALVNSYFRYITRYSQHHQICIRLSPSELEKCQERLRYLNEYGLEAAVRDLNVHGLPHGFRLEESSLYEKCLSQICELIPRMTALRDFTWAQGPVPHAVLSAVQRCPGIRLHAQNVQTYRISGLARSSLDRLGNNHNLYSLDVKAIFINAESCLATTRPLKQILLSCPNLKRLKLDIDRPRSGCVRYGAPREYCGFGFVDGERPPPLEELTLVAYPFGETERDGSGNQGMFYAYNIGYPLRGRELDYWAANFDWSRLKQLKTSHIPFAMLLMPKLTALQEVELDAGHGHEMITAFCQEIPSSLKQIIVPRIAGASLHAVLRHGATLRKLQIHEDEKYSEDWSSGTINIDSLRRIRDSCPLLEELGVDIARSGDWPYEMLDVLATFPRLRCLRLWFELSSFTHKAPVKPYLNYAAAVTLFRYLRARAPADPLNAGRRASGGPVRELEVIAGCPSPRKGSGFIIIRRDWPGHNSISFRCSLPERDDAPGAGEINVVCPDLTEDENRCLAEPGHAAPASHHSSRPGAAQCDDRRKKTQIESGAQRRFALARDGPGAWPAAL